MYRFLIITLIIVSNSLFAQDSTKGSAAFKENIPKPKYPLIKPKYPSYPLLAGFLLTKEANNGDPFAQHELGLRYLLGKGFKPDTATALIWIRKAVAQNLTAARFNYGIMQMNGIGTDWNPFAAFKNFKHAAEMGMPEGEYAYGLMFTDNFVVNRNYTTAYAWIKKSAEAGFEPAKKTLDDFRNSNLFSLIDTSYSIDRQKSPAYETENQSTATIMDQEWELDFFEFDEDSSSAENLDEKISDVLNQNTEELKNTLGIIEISEPKKLADTTGMDLVKYAAEMGSPEALLILGKSYEKGISLKRDNVAAVVSYIRSYRLGAYKAAENLIRLVQDRKLFETLKNRVDNDDPEAMFAWAGLVALGFDFSITEKQAFDLLLKAVGKEFLPAIIEVGLSYYSGSLVEHDKEKAISYLSRAADLGSIEAKIRIAAITIFESSAETELSEQIALLKKTSNEGSVLAETALGFCYENGKGISQDKARAVSLYRKAAQRGNEIAFNSLKRMYDEVRPEDEIFQIYEE